MQTSPPPLLQHLLEHIERAGVFVKNLALKAQLEGLHEIGLDRVNDAVAAVIGEINGLEDQLTGSDFEIDTAKAAQIEQLQSSVTILEQGKDQLNEENRLLRVELAALQNSIANPIPANAVPAS